ncbi:MAG: hypothetical protein RMK74_17205, partial [Myxococcales bacterium]|nr:hypothetical protein [Myxococcales bacterium]
MARRLVDEALVALALGYERMDRFVRRGLDASRQAIGALVVTAGGSELPARITRAVYRRNRRPFARERGLFPWERAMFARWLPPPPARLLVGGAGWGRECAALCAMGYEVVAFDPAVRAAVGDPFRAQCESYLGGYEDLAASVLDGADGPLAAVCRSGPYAAFVFGWTSLSHLLRPGDRMRAVRAAAVLCPSGPLLASFF